MFLFESWLSFCTAILVLFVFLYWYFTRNYDYWKKRGIKSPKAYPLIGSFVIPFTSMPLLHLEYAKKFGNIFGIFQGQKPILAVLDPTIIKRILVQDFAKFRNRSSNNVAHKITAQNLASARDEQWKRIRSILSPMFTNSKLRKIEPLIDSCIESMVTALDQTIKTSGVLAVHDTMGNFTMDVIAKCAFATDTNAHVDTDNAFVKAAMQIFKIDFVRVLVQALIPQSIKIILLKLKAPFVYQSGVEFLLDSSRHIMNERKRTGANRQDILQLMMDAEHNQDHTYDAEDKFDSHHVNAGEEENEVEKQALSQIIGSKYLTTDEILAQCFVFFLAGYETTASTLTFILYELAKKPDAQEKLFQELNSVLENGCELKSENLPKLEYLDAVISETLRVYSPAVTLNRVSGEDYRIDEYNLTLKKGDQVTIPVYAIHHSEQFYEDPEKWDPERFMPENRNKIIPYTYLPFGGGPRNCIGMRFAMSELKLGLAQLITKFEFFATDKTVPKLTPAGFGLLKTETVYVGIKRR